MQKSKLKTYFKIVGYVELISFAISYIILLVLFIKYFKHFQDWQIAAYICSFVFSLFFGPSVGLLFISHANNMKEKKIESGFSVGEVVIVVEPYKNLKKGDIGTIKKIGEGYVLLRVKDNEAIAPLEIIRKLVA